MKLDIQISSTAEALATFAQRFAEWCDEWIAAQRAVQTGALIDGEPL